MCVCSFGLRFVIHHAMMSMMMEDVYKKWWRQRCTFIKRKIPTAVFELSEFFVVVIVVDGGGGGLVVWFSGVVVVGGDIVYTFCFPFISTFFFLLLFFLFNFHIYAIFIPICVCDHDLHRLLWVFFCCF